jgi:transcription elongation factor Elf1
MLSYILVCVKLYENVDTIWLANCKLSKNVAIPLLIEFIDIHCKWILNVMVNTKTERGYKVLAS